MMSKEQQDEYLKRLIKEGDTDKVITQDAFPLDFRGMVVSPSSTYSGIVNDPGLHGNLCRFFNVTVSEMESYNNRLHQGTIRVTFETIFA